jgi:DtxR family Mn-dependent transcriptional regulator
MEDYLEAILTLESTHRVARVKDIAEALNVQMPSVTSALKTLKERGMVNYEKNSYIMLTDEGHTVAESVIQRHFAVAGFLQKVLCMPTAEAQDTACRIEHVITPDTAHRLQNLTGYIESHIRDGDMDSAAWEKIITDPSEGDQG